MIEESSEFPDRKYNDFEDKLMKTSLLKSLFSSILFFITVLLYFSPEVNADPRPPSVILDNNIVITTNEIPYYGGQLFKKYPLRWIVDKEARTAWVYEGDKDKMPKVFVDIPLHIKIDKIGIVNGYAKSISAYYDNNRIEGVSVQYSTSIKSQKIKFNIDLLSMQYFTLEAKTDGLLQINLNIDHTSAGKKFNDTCISDLDIISDGHSLINPDTYITSNGGEYPDFELFKDKKRIIKFEDNVEEAFFIEAGQYAVFKHGLGSLGITIYNIPTGKHIHVFPDLEIHTIIWKDGYFIGTASTQGSNSEFKYKKKIRLP